MTRLDSLILKVDLRSDSCKGGFQCQDCYLGELKITQNVTLRALIIVTPYPFLDNSGEHFWGPNEGLVHSCAGKDGVG